MYCELSAVADVCRQLGLTRQEFLELPDHTAMGLLAVHDERQAWLLAKDGTDGVDAHD